MIAVVCNHGFSPTFREIIDLVEPYIKMNKLENSHFQNGSRPGPTWMKNFMKRNRLSLKKAGMISSARISNTSNPFIIYDYYNVLEKSFRDNPDLDADRIYNCDESGFPIDQTNEKCITVKGERAFKLSFGARRENITVLAVANAAGIALDPFIIFKGKNLMESWFGTNAMPNAY